MSGGEHRTKAVVFVIVCVLAAAAVFVLPKLAGIASEGTAPEDQQTASPVELADASEDQSEDCSPIQFARGTSSQVIDGTVQADGSLCFSLAVSPGQTVRVNVISGQNVVMSIDDIGDARDTFEFVSPRDELEILVFQLMNSYSPEDFEIVVEVLPDSPSLEDASGLGYNALPGSSLEPVFEEVLGSTGLSDGSNYSNIWYAALEKSEGKWRDIYVESDGKYVNSGVVSLHCSDRTQPVAYRDFGWDRTRNPDAEVIVFSAERLKSLRTPENDHLSMTEGEGPPFRILSVLHRKYC